MIEEIWNPNNLKNEEIWNLEKIEFWRNMKSEEIATFWTIFISSNPFQLPTKFIFDSFFQLRKGVLELLTEEEENASYDLEVTTDEQTWREIMAKDTSAAVAVLKKKIEVRPRLLKLADFMSYFDTGN